MFSMIALLATAGTTTILVCPTGSTEQNCDAYGSSGLREAVETAPDSARVIVREGVYVPDATQDLAHREIVLRAFLVVRDKKLSIEGEGQVVIDAGHARPMSFLGAQGADLQLKNLTISNFASDDPDDLIYDGHGIYAVSSSVDLNKVTISHIAKMSVTGREDSKIKARWLRVLDSHIGVWLEEAAFADISHSLFVDGDTVGICAYGQSRAKISNSLFAGFSDDGIYASDDARIEARALLVTGNNPYGARAAGRATIIFDDSVFADNLEASGQEGAGSVVID